ncbi:competence/damage-inducible protein A [bacterium]|nr:competence/damage-inducible protein A [candidate division CSSED10-310 bacterium]
MKAEIVSIGDELLVGQTVNNNAAFIGRLMSEINVDVQWLTSVGDNLERMQSALEAAWNRVDLVLTTGGLGPTHDDITKDALCRFFGVDYTFHTEIVDEIKSRFDARGMEMPDIVRNQGLIPTGAELIRNELGSAFGIRFQRAGKVLIAMPGVPFEMERMMTDSVVPYIRTLTGDDTILIRKIKTTGIIESKLVTVFKRLNDVRALADVAVLPKVTGVELRLTVRSLDPDDARIRMNSALSMTQEDIGEWIVAVGEDTLEEILGRELSSRGYTVSVAESCTGGLLADRLTSVPGSSRYFMGGIVSYSNEIKEKILGVPETLLDKAGAVSVEVAEAMAAGIRDAMKTDFGVSTTGIAGPGGGTPSKPVGLAFIAVAGPQGIVSDRVMFNINREMNKQRFAQAALNLLRRKLLKNSTA